MIGKSAEQRRVRLGGFLDRAADLDAGRPGSSPVPDPGFRVDHTALVTSGGCTPVHHVRARTVIAYVAVAPPQDRLLVRRTRSGPPARAAPRRRRCATIVRSPICDRGRAVPIAAARATTPTRSVPSRRVVTVMPEISELQRSATTSCDVEADARAPAPGRPRGARSGSISFQSRCVLDGLVRVCPHRRFGRGRRPRAL